MIKITHLLFWLLIASTTAFAQMPDFSKIGQGGGGGSGGATTLEPVIDKIDSTTYFFVNNPNQQWVAADTFVDALYLFDPTRRTYPYSYLQLGDIGHAHKALAYQPILKRGFTLGFYSDDLYLFKNEEVKYYITPNAAFSDLHYEQANTQDDFQVKAQFANKIGKRMVFGLDYRRINQVGIYDRQRAKDNNLSASVWYKAPNGRYRAFLSYLTNTAKHENNGGITNYDEIVTGRFSTRSIVNVNLSDAQTEHYKNDVTFTQMWYLNGNRRDSIALSKKDSLPPTTTNITNESKANFLVTHQLIYGNETLKFFDTKPNTAVYKNFNVNDNGLRNYMRYHKIENTVKLGLEYKGILTAGLTHAIYFLNQEPQDTIINNLFVNGDWTLDLENDKIGATIKAHLGLADNAGDYTVDANAHMDFGKIGRLSGRFLQQLYQPSLMQYRLYVSKEQLWRNDFGKTLETNISATYAFPTFQISDKITFDLSGNGQNHIINNLVYWDTLAFPKQHDAVVNIAQLFVYQGFSIWNFHFDNMVGVQRVTNNILRLPTLLSHHSLYYKGPLFKEKMYIKMGVSARYNTNYFADNYQPVTGQFYQQDGEELSYLPIMDAFLSLRVQTLRAYVTVENLNHLALEQVYYVAPLYPMRDWFVRFGVTWKFLD